MPLLKQNEAALVDVGDADTPTRRFFIGSRHRQQERVVEQAQRLQIGVFDRQRQHHAIEFAANQLLDQQSGLRFADFYPQPGIFRLQSGQ